MSSTPERKRKRQANVGFAKLGDICAHFYRFLGKTPQPSDKEVRDEFIRCRTAWVNFCVKKGYDDETKLAFTKQVSIVWNKKKNTTESETQKLSQTDTSSSNNT